MAIHKGCAFFESPLNCKTFFLLCWYFVSRSDGHRDAKEIGTTTPWFWQSTASNPILEASHWIANGRLNRGCARSVLSEMVLRSISNACCSSTSHFHLSVDLVSFLRSLEISVKGLHDYLWVKWWCGGDWHELWVVISCCFWEFWWFWELLDTGTETWDCDELALIVLCLWFWTVFWKFRWELFGWIATLTVACDPPRLKAALYVLFLVGLC